MREGTIVDDYSHVEMDPITGIFTPVPRTLRLVHGESEVAGIYGGPFGIAYQRDRPCHDDYPTSICIQKDTPAVLTTIRPSSWRSTRPLTNGADCFTWRRTLNTAMRRQAS